MPNLSAHALGFLNRSTPEKETPPDIVEMLYNIYHTLAYNFEGHDKLLSERDIEIDILNIHSIYYTV